MSALATVNNSAADQLEGVLLVHGAPRGHRLVTDSDFVLKHYFGPHVYLRSLFRRKGTRVVGHEHTDAHFAIVLTGRLRIYSDGLHRDVRGGSEPFLVPAGVRKITEALEDTTLLTIHVTDETDLARLEEQLIVKSPIFREIETAKNTEALA